MTLGITSKPTGSLDEARKRREEERRKGTTVHSIAFHLRRLAIEVDREPEVPPPPVAPKKKPLAVGPRAKEVIGRIRGRREAPEVKPEPPLEPEITPPAFEDPDSLLQRIYPDVKGLTIEEFNEIIELDPDAFFRDLVARGRSEDTDVLLEALGLDDQAIKNLFQFGDIPEQGQNHIFEVEEEGVTVSKLGTLTPDGIVTRDGIQQGVVNFQTGEFKSIKDIRREMLTPSDEETRRVLRVGGVPESEIEKIIAQYKKPMTDEDWFQEWRKINPSFTKDIGYSLIGRSIAAGLGDVLQAGGGIAGWANQEKWRDNLMDTGAILQSTAPPMVPYTTLGETIGNPQFWMTTAPRTATLSVVAMVPVLLGAAAGAPIAGVVGLGATGTALLTLLFGSAAGALPEAALEAGAAWNEAKALGFSDEEADKAAGSVYWKNAGLLFGANVVGFGLPFAKVPGKAAFSALMSRGFVKPIIVGGKLVGTSLTEGGQEYFQDIITRTALGQEVKWDDEAKLVVLLGTILGGVTGGGLVVFDTIMTRTKGQFTPEQQDVFAQQKQQLLEDGAVDGAAELRAMDFMVENFEDVKTNLENNAEQVNREEAAKLITSEDRAEQLALDHVIGQEELVEGVTTAPPLTEALITDAERIVTQAEAVQPDNPQVQEMRRLVDEAKTLTGEPLREALIKIEAIEAEVKGIAGITEVPEVTPQDAQILVNELKRLETGETLSATELARIKRIDPQVEEDMRLAGRELAELEEVNTAIEQVLPPEKLREYKTLFFGETPEGRSRANRIALDALTKEGWLFDNGQWFKPVDITSREAMIDALRSDAEDLLDQVTGVTPPAPVARPEPVEGVPEVTEELEELKRVNPQLFRRAQKASNVEEFIASVIKADKTTRDKVSIPALTNFFNRVKGVTPPVVEAPPTIGVIPTDIEDAVRLAREAGQEITAEEITASSIAETIPPETIVETTPDTVDDMPIVHDVNVIDRFRPTRFVFEKMGLFDIWQSTFEAETLRAEEQVAFNKELKKHAKNVKGVARRELVWEHVNNSKSDVFKQLTFEEKQAAKWWKRTADDWANRLNIPQERRITDYIPHIFDEAALQNKDLPIDSSLGMVFSKKITDKVKMPFLEKRLGKELGLIKDPFLAAQAYQNVALRKFYYEPILQKLKLVAEHESTPEFARNYLKAYSQRMTGEPATIDREINKFLSDIADNLRGLPGGERLADMLANGNASAMSAYNLTSALYVMWLGFKPTTAIRNLSQHGLIIAEVDSIQDFGNGIRLRVTAEGRNALAESLVVRSRKGAFIESIDSSVTAKTTDAVRETALFMFRKADEQNVKDAFLSGYAEAKRLFPDADRSIWIKRGDEVAADTQYLYTKMNSLAIAQSGPGKVGAMLTTWAINWLELMNKFVRGKPSKVYANAGLTVKEKNWLQSRKSLIVYMTIVGLAYGLTQQDWNRVRAFEYTGFTSIQTFANLAGGEFPGLELPGAVADLIAGTLLDDERKVKTAWNTLRRSFSILNQVERVASGERDWLSLFFYLEGKNFQVRKLKEDWESNWKPYDDLSDPLVRAKEFPTLNRNTAQKRWREQNPKIEAQMFITNRLGTLSSDEAREEVLRLIDKHNIDTDVIAGYEKIFGVDTTSELAKFQKRVGQLEKFEIGKEAKYFSVGNFLTEANEAVRINGRDKVERDGHPLTVFLLGEQDSWQPYEDYDNTDARRLYRQFNPDVEASLYLAGKIQSFENPESAKILLQIMDKFNIPPQAVLAFNQDPDKYDELFTQKFELEQKNFDLSTQYENFGNSEAGNFIEDKEERKLAREKFKEDNSDWVADMRRIEAIDNDATPAQMEKWVERGKTIDEFGAGSSEAMVWLLDNPETHKWALDNELLTDDGSDWNEEVLRLNTELGGLEEGSEQHSLVKRKIQAHSEGFTRIDDFVNYYGLPVAGFRQERYLEENPEFATEMKRLKGIEPPDYLPPEEYDILKEKETLTPEEEHKIRAYDKEVPFSQIDNYVTYFTIEKPDDHPVSEFYKDDWFLIENKDFYQNVYLKVLGNQRRDFRNVPTREVFKTYLGYADTRRRDRLFYRWKRWDAKDREFEEWMLRVGKFTKHIKDYELTAEDFALAQREKTPSEKLAEEVQRRLRR